MKQATAARKRRPLPKIEPKAAIGYLVIALCMALMNFALPQRELVSFALYFAAITSGLNVFVLSAAYLIASAACLSAEATAVCAIQAAFLLLTVCIYRRLGRKLSWERALYAALAQLPFIFLFPHTGYELTAMPVVWQKTILAALLFSLALLFDGGLHALLFRAFRTRLNAGYLAEICLMWVFLGMGILSAFGTIVFYALSLPVLLLAVILLKNASAVPFGITLSLPLCLYGGSALPLAEYAVFVCLALLFCPYGKTAPALVLCLAFLGARTLNGLLQAGTAELVFTLLACLLPALLCICLPDKIIKRAKDSLLFYRERTLPRVAINSNRRAVGERLYEVSALFREIENAFAADETPDRSAEQIRERTIGTLCANCASRRKCENSGLKDGLDKLIAVGCAKGRVNLIDLPADITGICSNTAGLLFALNKQLSDYNGYAREMQTAREGRRLLAEQARGVSEILRALALEQSEEYAFSDEENRLYAALAEAGILSSELFLYGEGERFTVSVTAAENTSAKKLCEAAGTALGVPLSLSEKIPLTSDLSCFLFRRKAAFDAAFGIAARCKEGETFSGDTHSILKVDERRFLVALSDGMGSGDNARAVSDRTLSLLESFYKAKMPSETILSTVNRLIAFSSEEMFTCLDLASVDLDTGCADIVKIGSPVGFILSDELRVLEGQSLPMGMLEAIHPTTMRVNMKEDDFLLFMSDGITSAFGSSSDLYAYLSGLRPVNPQALAEEVLNTAIGLYRGKAEDDMTVLAVKLTKAA